MASNSYPQIFNQIILKERIIYPDIFDILKSVNFEENEENALRLCGQRALVEMGWISPPKPTLTIISDEVNTHENSKRMHFIARTRQLMYHLNTEELSNTLSTDEMILILTGL